MENKNKGKKKCEKNTFIDFTFFHSTKMEVLVGKFFFFFESLEKKKRRREGMTFSNKCDEWDD